MLSSKEEGITRLKCGRSDIKEDQRSESMSCSDKILKWNTLGFQGALMDLLLRKPIYLSSMIIESPYYKIEKNTNVMIRGLCPHFRIKEPSDLIFCNEPLI